MFRPHKYWETYWFLLLCFFSNVQAQTTKLLPANVAAIAAKYNQTIFGKNSFVFDAGMNMKEVQELIDSLHSMQTTTGSEFTQNRYALFFKPGTYPLNIKVGYYMHIVGLGTTPDEVVIVGSVSSVSIKAGVRTGHVLTNFWRSAENLTIIPTVDSTNTWAVSQAAPLRRVHVKGNLKLFDGASSGGFMANCKIDGTVFSGSQQQWFTRNSTVGQWVGGIWNMMYLGVKNAPQEQWPEKPVTTVVQTPKVREKPYWTFDDGKYVLQIPSIKKKSSGTDWDRKTGKTKSISLDAFYLANANVDNAASINNALQKGKHILFTPGIYSLSECLKITKSGTIMMGIGMATLVPENGNMAIEVADVEDVTVSSILIDAAIIPAERLMQVGDSVSTQIHHKKPTYLFDVFFRVGGPHEGSASNCLLINSNNVFVDHVWLWRADHGNCVGWNKNRSANGLIVNGNDVTIYGLFNEHFQEYQTIWNGERGRTFFYQSEMPYDPPSVDAWKHGNTKGYASYKVGDHVKQHWAVGLGIYNVFYDAPIIVDQAIETPEIVEKNFYHKVIFWLNGNKSSVVKSVINGKGGGVDSANRKRAMQ